MPTVSVGRDRLFNALGKSYTQEEFEVLCFKFGIELDDVTTEKAMMKKEKHLEGELADDGDDEVLYKIEVAANRYDLLCLEGIVRALRVFTMTDGIPVYKVRDMSHKSTLKMIVKQETRSIRPYVVGTILKGITFDEARYNRFIDLQEKLHQNICRKRTLISIGTHDLDSNRTISSMPPIINGAHSAINTETKNVFIECTATDLTKAQIALNTMVTMFCEYCERKFELEPVEVVYYDGITLLSPDLSINKMDVPLSDITRSICISLEASEVVSLLNKM